MSFHYWTFVFNFKDPASVFAYSLFSVHHDVTWYLIFILSIVYWGLSKVLKDFKWTVFKKQFGFNKYFYYRIFYYFNILFIKSLFFFLYIKIFIRYINIFYNNNFFVNIKKLLLFFYEYRFVKQYWLISKFILFFIYQLDASEFKALVYPSKLNNISFKNIYNLLILKNIDYLLFMKTNNFYYYDNFHNDRYFLDIQGFRHNTTLEFIWAIFPTIIIILILIPSMLLLYSLDEDLTPKLTIKVLGHQWFWSYEFDNWLEPSQRYNVRVEEMHAFYFSYKNLLLFNSSGIIGRCKDYDIDSYLKFFFIWLVRWSYRRTADLLFVYHLNQHALTELRDRGCFVGYNFDSCMITEDSLTLVISVY